MLLDCHFGTHREFFRHLQTPNFHFVMITLLHPNISVSVNALLVSPKGSPGLQARASREPEEAPQQMGLGAQKFRVWA